MLKRPLVSIITVVYNGEEHLEETILSIINQTYEHVEYIIIDGGSTDGTLKIIKKYEDAIDYWVSKKDSGIYDAMNKGIERASGEWINFINAGDRLIFLDLHSLNSLDTTNSCYYYNEEQQKIKRDPFTKIYLTHNTPCHQSIFYKRDELIPFDISYPIVADFEQMTKMCTRNLQPVYSEHLVYFAKAGFSYESNQDRSWEKLFSRNKIILKNMNIVFFIISLLHSVRIFLKR
nr:glycosyltransferase family 2 protein [Sulfurimonas hongkongensis]